MRLILFSILAAILLVTATARRGTAPPVTNTNIFVPQRAYPYGWGLGPDIGSAVLEEKEKEMKHVNRVVNKKKGKDATVPEKKLGWFRSTEHHFAEEADFHD